jgi:uncharacterized protein YabN with tetrapyrrole methylase and pyrophosphatase domain
MPIKVTEKVKLTLVMPISIDTQIKVEAAMQRKNISDVVVVALSEYLDRQERLRTKKSGGAA